MVDLTFLIFLFAFGLSFQLGLNRSLLRRARADASKEEAPAHPVQEDAPPPKLIDPKLVHAMRSWPSTLIWQYCCLMALCVFELLTGIDHAQIFLDIAGWALAFVAIDVGIMLADLITLALIWRGRPKVK
jgi:hypothetical protein